MLISTITGQENFPNCGCKVHLFAVPTLAHPGERKEVHVAYAAKSGSWGIQRNGRMRAVPAAPNHIDEYGKWFHGTFEVPDGVVLKLFAQRKAAEQVAGRHQIQIKYLRVRGDAALNRITVLTTGADIGQYRTVHTEGRFDVLDTEQVTTLGLRLPQIQRAYMADVGLMSCERIAGETAPAPVVQETRVQTPDGAQVVVRRTRRARALDL